MAEAESEAVRELLASYIQTQLRPDFPTIEVLGSWPSGTSLPEYAILVATAGDPDDTPHFPVVVSAVPNDDNLTGLVTYQYGRTEIPLMLDAWASSKSARRDLALAIRRVTNQPQQASLGVAGALPVLARKAYLSLEVPNLFDAIFTYCFQQVASETDSSTGAQKNEWRSTWRGTAYGPLWEQETATLVKQLQIQGHVGPGVLGKAAGNQPLNETRPLAPTSIVVTPATADLMIGAFATKVFAKATAIYSDAPPVDVTAQAVWGSSDYNVAVVASSGSNIGRILGVASGSASVTATFGGKTGVCAVRVP